MESLSSVMPKRLYILERQRFKSPASPTVILSSPMSIFSQVTRLEIFLDKRDTSS